MRPHQSYLQLLLGDKGSASLQHMRINRIADLKASFERHYTLPQLMSLRREHLNFTERYMYEQAGEALESSSHNPMAIYRYTQATVDKILTLINYMQLQHSVSDGLPELQGRAKVWDQPDTYVNKVQEALKEVTGADIFDMDAGIMAHDSSNAQAVDDLFVASVTEKCFMEGLSQSQNYPSEYDRKDYIPGDYNEYLLAKAVPACLDSINHIMFDNVVPSDIADEINAAIKSGKFEGKLSYASPHSHDPVPNSYNVFFLDEWINNALFQLENFNIPEIDDDQARVIDDIVYTMLEAYYIQNSSFDVLFDVLKQLSYLCELKFITVEDIDKGEISSEAQERAKQYLYTLPQQDFCQELLHGDIARSMQFFVSNTHSLDVWTVLHCVQTNNMLERARICNLLPASVLRNLPDLYYSLRELSVYLPYDIELYYYRALIASLLGFEQAALNDMQYFVALYSAFERSRKGTKYQLLQMTSGDLMCANVLYERFLENIPLSGGFLDQRGDDMALKYTSPLSTQINQIAIATLGRYSILEPEASCLHFLNGAPIFARPLDTDDLSFAAKRCLHFLNGAGISARPLDTDELSFAAKQRLEISKNCYSHRYHYKARSYSDIARPSIVLTESVASARYIPQDMEDDELCRLNVPKSRQLFLERAVRRDDSALFHEEDLTTPSLILSSSANEGKDGVRHAPNDDLIVLKFYLTALSIKHVLQEYEGINLSRNGELLIPEIVRYHRDRAPHARLLAHMIKLGMLGESYEYKDKTLASMIAYRQNIQEQSEQRAKEDAYFDAKAAAVNAQVIANLKYIAAEEERFKKHHSDGYYKLFLLSRTLTSACKLLAIALGYSTFEDEANNALYPDFPKFDRKAVLGKNTSIAALKRHLEGNLPEVEAHPCNPLVLNPKAQISLYKFMELLPETWADFVDKFTQSLEHYDARLNHIDAESAALPADAASAVSAAAAAATKAGAAAKAGATAATHSGSGRNSGSSGGSGSGRPVMPGHHRYGQFEAGLNMGFEHMMVNFFFDQLYRPWLDYARVPEFNGFVPVDIDYVRFVDNTARNYPLWCFDEDSDTHCLTLNTHLNAMEPAMQSWVLHYVEKQLQKHPVESLSFKADPIVEPQPSLPLANGDLELNTADIKVMVFYEPNETQEQLIRDFTAPNPIEDGRTLEFPDAQLDIFGSREQLQGRAKAQRQINYLAFGELGDKDLGLSALLTLDTEQNTFAKLAKGSAAKAKKKKGNKNAKTANKPNKAKQQAQHAKQAQQAQQETATTAATATAAAAAAAAALQEEAAAFAEKQDKLLGLISESGKLHLVVYAPMLMMLEGAQQACSKVQHYLLSLVGPAFYHHVIKSVRFTSLEQGYALEEKLGTNITSFDKALEFADLKVMLQNHRALVMGINDLPVFAKAISPEALTTHGLDCAVGYKVIASTNNTKHIASRGELHIEYDPVINRFSNLFSIEDDFDDSSRMKNVDALNKQTLAAVLGETHDYCRSEELDKKLFLIAGTLGNLATEGWPNRLDVLYGVSTCMPLIEEFYQHKKEPQNLLPYNLCNVDYLRSVGASPFYLPIYFPADAGGYTNDSEDGELNEKQIVFRMGFMHQLETTLRDYLREHGATEQMEITGYAVGSNHCYIDFMLWGGAHVKRLIVDCLRQYPHTTDENDTSKPLVLGLQPF